MNSLARGACNCPPGPSNRPCCSFPDADVNPDVDNQNEQQSDAQKSIKKKRKSSMSKDYAYRPNCSIEIPEGMLNENQNPQQHFIVKFANLVSRTFLFLF